jgi:hypothetical protein
MSNPHQRHGRTCAIERKYGRKNLGWTILSGGYGAAVVR